jgi:HSP20 family protein
MATELTTWSPLRELDNFRRSFDEMFDRFTKDWFSGDWMRVRGPAIESWIEDGTLVVRADLPGVDPKDVEVTVTGDTLTLRGKREHMEEKSGRDYFHREVSYGSFERSISLPKGVKAEEIKATYKNGVLDLRMPLPKELSARKVPVTVETDAKQA